jgi:FixJ family two-component response regulator
MRYISGAPCPGFALPRGSRRRFVLNSSRILIVDDDESVRQALKGLLKSAGFSADAFASAEEFLSSGQLQATSCLILDVRMPGMSGVELQERLIASNAAVPIIFISAHGDEDVRARALQRGAVDFLQKPFSDEALLDAIARVSAQSP